jgi:hypothetical protein
MMELMLLVALAAQPKSWIWESEEASEQESKLFRFSPRLNFWVANFDRPPRACRTTNVGLPEERFALRAEQFQFPDAFCPSEDSDEFAFGSGLEISFRTWGPFYITAGIDFVYTAPQSSSIKNQLVLALPFGLTITWYEWAFRPIASFAITPVLYVTDDSRDFTVGGNGGVAYRILDFGSISLTAGYLWAETMTAVQVQLGLHPIL